MTTVKYVRPRMTVEARDALNDLCESAMSQYPNIDDRSEAIIYVTNSCNQLLSDTWDLIDERNNLSAKLDDAKKALEKTNESRSQYAYECRKYHKSARNWQIAFWLLAVFSLVLTWL